MSTHSSRASFLRDAGLEMVRGVNALRLFVGITQIVLGIVFITQADLFYDQPNYAAIRDWRVLGQPITAAAWGLLSVLLGILLCLSVRITWSSRWLWPWLSLGFWGALTGSFYVATGITGGLALNACFAGLTTFILSRSSMPRFRQRKREAT